MEGSMAGSDTVQSVERALDIVERVAAAAGGVSLPELAEAMALPTSTVHNLARTLAGRGYLVKRARPPRYELGPTVAALAAQTARHAVWRLGETAVRKVAAACPEGTVVLAHWEGREVAVALRMHPSRPGVVERPSHRALAPYNSASAMVMQAFLPPEQLHELRRLYPFAEDGAAVWSSEAALAACLAEVRHAELACLRRLTEGRRWLSCAVPVFTARQELAASLGVSIPLAKGQSLASAKRRVRELLHAAARPLREV
jgi:IclR family transcriptional regulator, acetate operon repressor